MSALVFTGIWYTGKNIAKNIAQSQENRLEQAKIDLEKLTEKHAQEASRRLESHGQKDDAKATDHLTAGKPISGDDRWGYTGNLAPGYWGSISERWSNCASKLNQSPIDISGSKLDERLKSLKLSYKHGEAHLTLRNSTIQGDIQSGSYIEWDGERFDLNRVFFRTPSEHRVNGLPWEMEVQLEHKSARDEVIMISVLVTHGRTSPILEEIAANLPRFREDTKDFSGIHWLDFFPKKKTYWKYIGSSTIPPCEPNVTWLVMTEPVSAKAADIDRFVKLQKSNVRPVYALGKRHLGRSNR
jgi:carbonic anhydrase